MSKLRFKIIEEAELELDRVYNYYEYELEEVGKRFLEEFKRGIKYIVNLGYLEENLIIILAIAHQHRKPYYWIDRLDKL